jgi:hypothetical protein
MNMDKAAEKMGKYMSKMKEEESSAKKPKPEAKMPMRGQRTATNRSKK